MKVEEGLCEAVRYRCYFGASEIDWRRVTPFDGMAWRGCLQLWVSASSAGS